ncbi:MAG: cupin domain-containing protein [Chloroflexi bacterium]|nr:cupin domain-containing protein [Chloroflexota bacterium]
MSKYVIRPDEVSAYSPLGHSGAVDRKLVSRETTGARYMEVMLGTVSPEGLTEAHFRTIEQAVYMLEGSACVEIDGNREKVSAGEMAFFPAGSMHRITPAGGPYKCLIIYAPPLGSTK